MDVALPMHHHSAGVSYLVIQLTTTCLCCSDLNKPQKISDNGDNKNKSNSSNSNSRSDNDNSGNGSSSSSNKNENENRASNNTPAATNLATITNDRASNAGNSTPATDMLVACIDTGACNFSDLPLINTVSNKTVQVLVTFTKIVLLC